MEKPEDLPPISETQSQASKSDIKNMSEVGAFTTRELDRLKIIYQGVDNSRLLKAFRDLRTRLYNESDSENFVCLVTSVCAGGGGSYVAMNLASAIALDKTKTSLLIDCNLYAPHVHNLLPISSQAGLTDWLDEDAMGVEQIVYATCIPRMRAVPVGNNCEGGTEKINSSRMKNFINEVKNRYKDRYIIIDGPSVTDYVAETRILAEIADCVILVVPYGKALESQITEAIDAIGKERLAGLIFNNS